MYCRAVVRLEGVCIVGLFYVYMAITNNSGFRNSLVVRKYGHNKAFKILLTHARTHAHAHTRTQMK